MPTAGTTHDITISDSGQTVGFMLRKGSYGQERADDFAPRIATGDDPRLREGIWQTWAQEGAPEGVDQYEFENRNRVYWSDGNVFLSRSQGITLQAAWNSSDASKSATAPQFVDLTSGGSNFVAAAIGTKVRRYNIGADTWTDSTTTLGASAVSLHRHNAYVFAACGSGADFYRSADLDTWAQPAAGQKATCFCTVQNRDPKAASWLVLATGSTFKASSDDGANWSSAYNVGNPDTTITGLGAAFGLMIIGKEDGLYTWDGVQITEEIIFPNKRYIGNCKAIVYHDGFLYTHILADIVKLSFSGGGVANMVYITPEMRGSENKELCGHGIPIWLWSGPRSLYAAFDDGETVYPEVMSYNGLGWQQEYRGTSGDSMLAGGYSRLASRSFINDGASRYRKHATIRDLPFPDYAATGQFITSHYTGGLPWMHKAYRDVQVECENVSVGIGVEYSLSKGDAWVAFDDEITTNGKVTLLFPGAAPVEAQQLSLRFTLRRNSATSAPRMRRYAVGFLVRPNPIYVFTLTMRLSPAMILRDQSAEQDTVAFKLAFLRGAEASGDPVVFTDSQGRTTNAYVTRTRILHSPEKFATDPPDEMLIQVTFLHVNLAGFYDAAYYDSAIFG